MCIYFHLFHVALATPTAQVDPVTRPQMLVLAAVVEVQPIRRRHL